jgi:D-hydroxyproline dehydrogenase subunit beta
MPCGRQPGSRCAALGPSAHSRMIASPKAFDLAVVGAGILGLSCALAAARRGVKVLVIERNVRARGASVRNFGLVTVTGQDRDTVWRRARRSPEVWQEVAQEPGIPIVLQGLWVATRLRVESRDAIPMLADWLARTFGVAFRRETAVHAVDPPRRNVAWPGVRRGGGRVPRR